ncbi:hypothetical protein AbraIFM66951_011484 [Aspergillus brasiliensis]|uniref:Xaa-Pro dipeptidyl-peptidase C-terminal domain-containing protein n=1 Tax=Aspergillus brasiliensis TaxID=319629 RepID=A0A9W5YUU2_9EURO|nr:hypothetical protein AbraCBS73388_008765 [Aspergillus brasiliensis]GKZ47906.1 hypothetical protein AbraIFM66951_011484 [Aspergillus brasiliensis]
MSLLTQLSSCILNLYRLLQIFIIGKTVITKRRPLDNKQFDYNPAQNPKGPFLPVFPIVPLGDTNYSSQILKEGHCKEPGLKALECDILVERNVPIPMRDGVKLYADIYRPVDDSQQVPIILVWSPYGKHLSNDGLLGTMPERLGLERSVYSGYEDFEGPDPAFFVPKGYAVVNIDVRGAWASEGDLHFWGKQDEADGYDAIEHLAQLPWTNGKIGLSGNSWLAISQWFIAAGNPPHLAAIAPWEGLSDGYRDQHRRGGIPSAAMPGAIGLLVPSFGLLEDAGGLAEKRATWDEYWDDKKAELSKIKVPAYVLASYSSKIHSAGSFRGFRNISSKDKWLRVHPYQEWYDFATEQGDLERLFCYYLKGVDNGWLETPRVRCSLLKFNGPPVVNKPFESYPPSESRHIKYFLDASTASGSAANPVKEEASCYYEATKTGNEVHFDIRFDQTTTLIGYPTIHLNVQCHELDDMDIFVILRKLDKSGKPVNHVNFPTTKKAEELPKLNPALYQGPTGMLRASHREVRDSPETAPGELFHPHETEVKIPRGHIVDLELSTWPIGAIYEAGESLRLSISGENMCYVESHALPKEKNRNRGRHIIHTGGKFQSWISLPVLN